MLSAAESIRNMDFNFPWIGIRTRGLISYKCICNATKYIGQLLISIIVTMEF